MSISEDNMLANRVRLRVRGLCRHGRIGTRVHPNLAEVMTEALFHLRTNVCRKGISRLHQPPSRVVSKRPL
jgi:hypothetical protein